MGPSDDNHFRPDQQETHGCRGGKGPVCPLHQGMVVWDFGLLDVEGVISFCERLLFESGDVLYTVRSEITPAGNTRRTSKRWAGKTGSTGDLWFWVRPRDSSRTGDQEGETKYSG